MIRSKGEAGTGNIVEAVRHLRTILGDIKKLTVAEDEELYAWAKELLGAGRPRPGGRRARRAARSRCSAPAGSPLRPTRRS